VRETRLSRVNARSTQSLVLRFVLSRLAHASPSSVTSTAHTSSPGLFPRSFEYQTQ
jgi:hypothetical protein